MDFSPMPLIDVPFELSDAPLPDDVSTFLRVAQGRIDLFQRDSRVPGFVSCDLERTYRFLHSLAAHEIAAGRLFCEWGSGFGVVACLAAMLGYDAVGIEINGELVRAARELAEEFRVNVEFLHGSFIPPGETIDAAGGFSWLETDSSGRLLDIGPDDFNVIFAYPWPAEEAATEALFERRRPGRVAGVLPRRRGFSLMPQDRWQGSQGIGPARGDGVPNQSSRVDDGFRGRPSKQHFQRIQNVPPQDALVAREIHLKLALEFAAVQVDPGNEGNRFRGTAHAAHRAGQARGWIKLHRLAINPGQRAGVRSRVENHLIEYQTGHAFRLSKLDGANGEQLRLGSSCRKQSSRAAFGSAHPRSRRR